MKSASVTILPAIAEAGYITSDRYCQQNQETQRQNNRPR